LTRFSCCGKIMAIIKLHLLGATLNKNRLRFLICFVTSHFVECWGSRVARQIKEFKRFLFNKEKNKSANPSTQQKIQYRRHSSY
jgi:hypothetical protein